MTLNPDVVRTRVSEIEESVARLERFAGLSVDEFTSNFTAAIVAILPPAGEREGPA